MLLSLAYIPEYAARLVFIIDDTLDVWQVPSDQQLVHPIQKQRGHTSHQKPDEQQELSKFALLASTLWGKAYASGTHNGRSLKDLEIEVAKEHWHRHLYSTLPTQQ